MKVFTVLSVLLLGVSGWLFFGAEKSVPVKGEPDCGCKVKCSCSPCRCASGK